MTSPDPIVPVRTPVTAALPRRASRRLRIVHAVSYAALRRFFDLAVRIDRRGSLAPRHFLFVVDKLDPLLAPLRPARGTCLRKVVFEDFRAEWVWDRSIPDPDAGRDPAAILYLHGGGLVCCGLNTHRRLVARIARTAGVPLLNVDYRQIPQGHVLDSVEDCLTAYRYLLDRGIPAERILLAGDSAGGGLAFSLALAARDRGLPLPAGLVAIAPWANYDSTIKRAHPNNDTEPILRADVFAMPARWGVEIDGKLDPAWSPVNRDFTGLPPVLIQVGSTEVLLADPEQLAARCADAGVPVTVQIWDHALHVFQVGADVLPDARAAIEEIGSFMRDLLDNPVTPYRDVWAEKAPA